MLGFQSARKVVELGRAAFFGTESADLPAGRSAQLRAHDLTPQFGFVGERYEDRRVLILGINPGNGKKCDVPTAEDARMMPSLEAFAKDPTEECFAAASKAYMGECQRWPVWKRHCREVLGSGALDFIQVAYSNCLPWRTASESNFAVSVGINATNLYVRHLIDELEPRVVIALGKRATTMLPDLGGRSIGVVTWNRARAATANVLSERIAAAARIFEMLNTARP